MFRCQKRECATVRKIDSVSKHVKNQHQANYGEVQNCMKLHKAVQETFKMTDDLLIIRKQYFSVIDNRSSLLPGHPSLPAIK